MGDLVPFDEAARRVRARRESGRVAGSDMFWAACLCCTPFGLAWFVGFTIADASLKWGQRR